MLRPVINFDQPDGTFRSLFVGAVETIAAAEAGIRSALAEAHGQQGRNICIRIINDSGNCVRAWKIGPP